MATVSKELMGLLFVDMTARMEILIYKATSDDQPDWQGIMILCDAINLNAMFVKPAIVLITVRLNHDNPNVVNNTLALIDSCWANCGAEFRREIAAVDFIVELRAKCKSFNASISSRSRAMLAKWVTAEVREDNALAPIRLLHEELLSEKLLTSSSEQKAKNNNTQAAQSVEHRNYHQPNDADTSIANDNLDDLSDQCCCAICNETFDSDEFVPRVLDCGHTFCQVCIYNERIFVNNQVKCPTCSRLTDLNDERELPRNFTVIGLTENLIKSRADPKVVCTSCEIKYSSTAVRMCLQEGCNMFNQLICLSCVVDGGHGSHRVVKYDVKMEKVRERVSHDVANLCLRIEEKKRNVLDKAEKLVWMVRALKKRLAEVNIPEQVIRQVDTIDSEQEAREYKEIVEILAQTVMDECDSLAEIFDLKLSAASGLDDLDEEVEMAIQSVSAMHISEEDLTKEKAASLVEAQTVPEPIIAPTMSREEDMRAKREAFLRRLK